jgi:hypothetical protein
MRTQRNRAGQLAILSILMCLSARGGDLTIDWSVIASGTETSVGGAFELARTIGQSFAGVIEGDNLVLETGFWSYVVESTNGAPLLSVSIDGGRVTITWDPGITNYLLEETSNLSLSLTMECSPGRRSEPRDRGPNRRFKNIPLTPDRLAHLLGRRGA